MSTQHLTPMLLCAHDVTLKILASVGRKFSPIPSGDPIARWASCAFRAVNDLELFRPPPKELLTLCERAERREASPQEQRIVDVCALPLLVWTRVDDALSSTPDPEGDGSPDEHDAERAKRAAAWESTGKAKALASVEAALAEILPKVVERLLASP